MQLNWVIRQVVLKLIFNFCSSSYSVILCALRATLEAHGEHVFKCLLSPFHRTVSLSNREFLCPLHHQCSGFEQVCRKYDELKGSQPFGMPQTEFNKLIPFNQIKVPGP